MDIKKDYDLWLYPQNLFIDKQGYNIFRNFSSEAIKLLEKGENVILFPELDSLQNSIEGFLPLISGVIRCFVLFLKA